LINFQHSESNAMKNVLSYFSSKTWIKTSLAQSDLGMVRYSNLWMSW
jgi:hypothetical protein